MKVCTFVRLAQASAGRSTAKRELARPALKVFVQARPLPGLLLFAALLFAQPAFPATNYVWQDSPNPGPPFTNWATAAHTIQDAVDASAPGDEIVVTNGVYATGGRAAAGFSLTNRVVIDKAITVRSVNGREFTAIQGAKAPEGGAGDGAMRCVYLGNGATLSGFTLTNGATASEDWFSGATSLDRSGGGVWCESTNALVTDCVLTGNAASFGGGGARGGTLWRCLLTSNAARFGGGAAGSVLFDSQLISNSVAMWGGGVSFSPGDYDSWGAPIPGTGSPFTMVRCVLIGNMAAQYGGGVAGPYRDYNESGRLLLNLDFACTLSECTLDGNWVTETNWGQGGGSFSVWLTACTLLNNAAPHGGGGASGCILSNCTLNSNSARYGGGAVGSDLSDCRLTNNVATICGGGVSFCPATFDENGIMLTEELPGCTLNKCMLAGDSSAQYGGGAVASYLYDCTLMSNSAAWNGGGVSSRPATYDENGVLITAAVPCRLNNCTLTGNSAGWTGGGADESELSNCRFTNNSAAYGGGAAWGMLSNCALSDNSAEYGGGAFAAYLFDCTLMSNSAAWNGGGVSGRPPTWDENGQLLTEELPCTLTNCTLTGNSARFGGGAANSSLNNCTLTGNSATNSGGGAAGGTLNNCTVTGNTAVSSGGGVAGIPPTYDYETGGLLTNGRYGAEFYNCIVYFNTAPDAPNYQQGDSPINYSCTAPLPTNGTGNITNEPAFLDYIGGNLRLETNSPCIDAGHNDYAQGATDRDGRPRIVGARVDMGAYEFQGEFDAWLSQFALPTGGPVDFTDPDGDRLDNYQEYRCGTNPTNAWSVLRLLTPEARGADLVLRWTSVTNRVYFLECSTNLGASPLFQPLATNLPSQGDITTFRQTDVAGPLPRFYRVKVEVP
jgi:hypothetical protein